MGLFYGVLIGQVVLRTWGIRRPGNLSPDPGRSAESQDEFGCCSRVLSRQGSSSDSRGAPLISQVYTQRESPLGRARGMVEGALISFDWIRGFVRTLALEAASELGLHTASQR
jgi:hypothetical protein